MRLFAHPLASLCLFLACAAESRPFDTNLKAPIEQSPLQNYMMPPSDASSGIIISDLIGRVEDIAIFNGLTHHIDAVSGRLDDAAQNATVLAPNNTVMKNMKTKPWKDPEDYNQFGAQAYEGTGGSDRAQSNLERFLNHHIIPESPWEEGKKVKTLAGNEVWWESKNGQKSIQPGNIEVTSIADKAANGEIWAPRALIMNFESGDLAICEVCGTQFDVPLSSPPENCRICLDPRQYVPAHGQTWTSLNAAQDTQKNEFHTDEQDPRIHYITTKPLTPSELPPGLSDSTTTRKQLGIGQRAILLQTAHGSILWDAIAFLNRETVDFVNSKGGLKAIVISHPHFYTSHLEWAAQFGCPVYVAADDAEWQNRADAKGVRVLFRGAQEVVPGVTAVQCGGHFDGSSVLHWEKKLFIADTMMSVPSGFYNAGRAERDPKTTAYSFMWSYPNMIPLPPSKIHGIWKALKPYEFDATFGGFMGQNVARTDLKKQVLDSMKTFVRVGGHENAELFEEMY
ncbi:hypothetical protein C7974DRAFT_451534 [Boeremia exigua]|uniref:uncharacterized protein n=1 Tax=Boeremia exigua TaxID=749465 RepID=UPI001E8CE130|nr:uncharacterized protein C7974DRAFT_451534 [Boeremia exigua]KAH6638237.1 hypothetical protein C7974DRAFT_451534 [Boeremia exigua]